MLQLANLVGHALACQCGGACFTCQFGGACFSLPIRAKLGLWGSTRLLRNCLELLLTKVPVKTECGSPPQFPHGLKADAIHQAQLFPSRRQHNSGSGAVAAFRNPIDSHQRLHVLEKSTQGGKPQPVLQQGARFQQHIVVGQQVRSVAQHGFPRGPCTQMITIVAIHYSVERRRVNEDRHRFRIASARYRSCWALPSFVPEENRPAARRARPMRSARLSPWRVLKTVSTPARTRSEIDRPLSAESWRNPVN